MKPNVKHIPKDPGVYLFYDRGGDLMYIGKAKNLRNRVRSYWSNGEFSPSKLELLRDIARVDYIAVNNEKEALLLEAGLIKKHQPKYNIVLRDDKSWSHIVITHEKFPRIVKVHGSSKIQGDYFGPYTKPLAAKVAVRLLHQMLPLRTGKKPSKLESELVSLRHLGPAGKTPLTDPEAYAGIIEQARRILKGDTKQLRAALRTEMKKSAQAQEYERAGLLRNKIQALETLAEPQHVVHPLFADQDIVHIAAQGATAVITVMQLRGGQMLDTLNFSFNNPLRLPSRDIMEQFIAQYYGQSLLRPRELVLPFTISPALTRALSPLTIRYPQRGARKRMLEMASKNAWIFFHHKTQTEIVPASLYALKDILGLSEIPLRIEGYDISNIAGTYAVGAMVVAKSGKLAPSEYRKFKIKTVIGPDDVRMMREVLMRRQKHDEWPAPQLILLDGGKPQLSTVYPILKSEWKHRAVALAKRKEELFVPGRRLPLRLGHKHPALLLLRRIRDEAHRKAISYYRLTHRKRWKE